MKLNRPDSALYYLQKAAVPDNAENRIVVWNHLGNLYTQRKEYAKALSYYRQSIELNTKQFRANTILAASHLGIGQLHEARQQFPQALASYQTALQKLHFTFKSADVYKNPEDFENAVSRLDLFKALRHKAAAFQKYYLLKKQNLSVLEAALQTSQTAIRLAEDLRLSYDSDEAKLFFSGQVFPVYEQALTAAFLLFEKTGKSTYAEQAFVLSEKSKAAVLAESLHGLQIGKQKGVPTNLLRQERELRRKIARLTVSSLEARDSAQSILLRDQIRDGEIALSQLMRKLNAHSKYYQLKYNRQPVGLAHLQSKLLDSETTLVEYFYGEKDLYAFVITNDQFQVLRLSADTIFKNTLSQYQSLLYGHHSSPQQPVWANALYRKLVAPLNIRTKKLLLIPDGELNYLPFEALIGNLNEHKYLLHEYRVRYAYSATLLDFFRQQKDKEPSGEMLAMAPFAGQSDGAFRDLSISPLPASRQEVEQTGGRIYLESAATKEVFLKTASRYGIIHLATHAQADSREPLNSYIAFHPRHPDSLSGYRLYTSELYNLELDSVKLVVLSACETGGGRLVRGEGVMSLARGFAYAGCPNIVMTLWRAEDRATAWLTTRLHHYLRKGYDKDEALYQAKKDYLAEAPSARRQPYYWANLVLVGDDVPVYPSQQRYWIWGILILGLLVGIGVLWRKWKGAEKRMVRTVSG